MATKKTVKVLAAITAADAPGDILESPDSFAPPIARLLTVNGEPVPERFAHLISYNLTDQGIAEANAGKAEPSGVQVNADAWDKMLAHRASAEPWEEVDPMRAAVERYGQPGFDHKFLGPATIDRKGMRKYEPVVDAKSGEQVRVGRMILGRIPVELKERRNAHYQRLGNEMLEEVERNYATDQDKAIREAGSEGVSVLRRGDELHDSRDPERGASIGVQTTRGLQKAA